METAGGRRLTAKGVLTRGQIVETAARLIYANGVAGTSLEDVRTAAGVSNSQLYHYFADKSELVRAVIRRQIDAVLDLVDRELSGLATLAGLQSWRDAIVAQQRAVGGAGGCPLGSLVGELAVTDDDARRELAEGFRRWNEAIEHGLTGLRGRGVLRPEANPRLLALSLLAALQGGLVLTQAQRDVFLLEASLDGAIDYIASFAVDPDRRSLSA